MTAIERTAYPRLKKRGYKNKELLEIYTPTRREYHYALTQISKKEYVFHFLLHLKIFQRIGRFTSLKEAPSQIVKHIQKYLNIEKMPELYKNIRPEQRHKNKIREFLKIKIWDHNSRSFATKIINEKSYVMDNPADLINAIIEILIKNRYELPAFSVIDRMVRNIRNSVNNIIFDEMANKIPLKKTNEILQLFEKENSDSIYTFWNRVKKLPKKPTLYNLKNVLHQLEWLISYGEMKPYTASIPTIKVNLFAAIGKAYTADQMKDFRKNKRISIAICLLYRRQVQTRDDIINMFIKRISKFHVNAKEELRNLQEKHIEKTNKLLVLLSGIISSSDELLKDKEYGQSVRNSIDQYGGKSVTIKDCEDAIAYTSQNWYPLIWK